MAEPELATPLDTPAAARLISRQFPELRGQEVLRLAAKGTDNHIFRIGPDLCARFPKVAWASGTAAREAYALSQVSGAPLSVPKVYGAGAPGEGYPHEWSVLSWLPGVPLEDSALKHPGDSARQLAAFIGSLRRLPPDDTLTFGPGNNWRGGPLTARTVPFEAALDRLPGGDFAWARRLWGEAIRAGPPASPVWLHGDIHPGNVLTENGAITGIIDWGLCGVGDGACDLLCAWAMFDRDARNIFRASLGATDAEWLRGAGWALSMATIFLPYARENALPCDMSERMIDRLKEDFA